MAGCIFVKQGIIEQDSAFADGAFLRHQGTFAQISRSLIHRNHGLEQFFPRAGMDFHGLSILKPDGEVLDQLSPIGQGFGGVDDSLRHSLLGGDETLLRGDIGVEGNALEALVPSAAPAACVHHTNGQIRAVGRGIMEGPDFQAVQIFTAFGKICIVLLPGLNGVFGHPGSKEDGLPQLFHGCAGPHSGKHFLGPGLPGHRGNAPLIPVFPTIQVGLQNGIGHLSCLGDLFHINAFQAIRVCRLQMDSGRQSLAKMLLTGFLPGLHRTQGLDGLVADVEFLQFRVIPLHRHLPGFRLVGFFHHHLNKLRLVQIRINNHILPLLDIDAAADNQSGILSENGFLHCSGLLCFTTEPILSGFTEKVNVCCNYIQNRL